MRTNKKLIDFPFQNILVIPTYFSILQGDLNAPP